jgi:hypothetical protein
LLPLIAGGAIYILFRKQGLLGFQLDVFSALPNYPTGLFLINVMPDFFWAYSFCSALFLFALWFKLSSKYSSILIFILVCSSEIIQLFLQNRFTFDFFDLLASVIAFLLSGVFLKAFNYEK